MRDHSNHICLQREDAVEKMLSRTKFVRHIERVLTRDALNRVLAEDAVCAFDLPNSLCSRMDAIAVHFSDFSEGIPDVSNWEENRQYCFANTGTSIGGDFDTCIKIESVEFDDANRITRITHLPECSGEMTIAPGSRYQAGKLIVSSGALLTPAKLTALALAGIAEVAVVAKPRIVFIPTGDELVPLGFPLPKGKTYEANSIMVATKLKEWGADPYIHPILSDDWDSIKSTVLTAADEYDIVVLNAGSSKGSKDFNLEVLEEEGEIICHEVNHGPGHHSSYSLVHGTPVVGISGPPTGAEYTTDWYLKPLVDMYLYGKPVPVKKVRARLGEDLPQRGYPASAIPMFGARRGILTEDATTGDVLLEVLGWGSGPELVHEDDADCFVCIYNEMEGSPAGTEVEVELRYPYRYPGACLD